MEQILAQTQAELEQEGWVFDVTEQPDIPAKNVYRFVVEGARSISIGQTDEQMPSLFEYLSALVQFGSKWVEETYGALYPVEGYLRYEGELYKLVHFSCNDDGVSLQLVMSIAPRITRFYENGRWVDKAFNLSVHWDERAAHPNQITSRYVDLSPALLIVADTGDYIGDVGSVLNAIDNREPFEVKVENADHTVTYTCTQMYQASPTRISFYSSYEKGGVLKTIEVRINPEEGYVEVRR